MEITFENSSIHFTNKGSGNPLILLHGFLESVSIWNDLQEKLAKNRQVVCIDLPGHGKTGNFAAIHSIELMADVVNQVLLHLNIKKADFAGHSMGGYVCTEFLKKYPEKINKVALINSTPSADSEEKKENRNRAINLVKKNKDAFVSMAISNLLTPENNLKFKSEIQDLKAEAIKMPAENIIAAIFGMRDREDRKEAFKNHPSEKYIVIGMQDPVLDVAKTTTIAKNTGSHIVNFPDGHLSYLENKPLILNFLQSIA
ncbi:alpha/beta fold hydrolase [Zunongwangia sp.]|uniref:alpha/beta fold hydrolase n=1 Tax=Zunongwangia sp. TaxID=1965325 RepID=UPI003AA9A9C7